MTRVLLGTGKKKKMLGFKIKDLAGVAVVEGKFSKAHVSPFSFYKHMKTLYNSYIKLSKRAGP